MPGLLAQTPQAARPFSEPLRPADLRWRGRNGDLRADLGPMLPLVHAIYPSGTTAVARQEDGSGFAMYPSGRKAICIVSFNKSRRLSAVAYAERDFAVHSAVPIIQRGDGDSEERSLPRTRHLGAMDEWGIGSFRTVPDESTGAQGLYEVSNTSVTVQTTEGRKIQAPRKPSPTLNAHAAELRLRLNAEITVSYDVASGTTLLEFSCDGVQHSFHVGEVWRGAQTAMLGRATSPAAVFDTIPLRSQAPLDASCSAMLSTASTLEKTLKIPSGTATLKSLGLTSSTSAPNLMTIADTVKGLCEGRIKYNFEHELRRKVATTAPPLAKASVKQSLKEGFTYPRPPIAPPPLWPQKVVQPMSLQAVSARQVGELVSELEGQSALLVVLVVASWATASQYSSSNHATVICEAALGELHNLGEAKRLRFCTTEVTEAGAIVSETRWTNPLVKQYAIKSVPWMLVFSRGNLTFSGNPSGEGGVGLGAATKLRYMAFAKPRVLILEPAPLDTIGGFSGAPSVRPGGSGANCFKRQLEIQDALKRSGFSFDLAVTVVEARRLAAESDPPYGIFMCSSEVGAATLTEIAARVRLRCPKALTFMTHNQKELGPMDESLRAVADKRDVVAHVFDRPLSKSQLEHALVSVEAVRVKYPECGMTKDKVVELIRKYLRNIDG